MDPIAAYEDLRGLDARITVWARPEDSLALVGLGLAWEFSSAGPDRFTLARDAWTALMRDALTPAQAGAPGGGPAGGAAPADAALPGGPLAMGGFAFSAEADHGALWRGFGASSLALPELTIAATAGGVTATLAAVLEPEATDDPARADRPLALLAAVERVAREIPASGTPAVDGSGGAPAVVVEEFPPADTWKAAVAAAATAVREGRLAKVVLARGVRVRGHGADPAAALRRLRAGYPSCTLFAVERAGRCFLGATPERLARVAAGRVHTMALAGSAPRGATDEDDRAIGRALLASAKDRLEHALVVEALREALDGMCETLELPSEPSLLRVSNVQHLCTPLAGVLRAGAGVLDVAGRLHPTPAVGGVPRASALPWIGEHEGFDRGWYAGPVGWVDRRGDGEFAVALRCALTDGDEAVLFGGCGIVADSDPDAEYAEAGLKLRPMLSALGANGTR
jgi:isochorismate synthase